MHVLAVRFELIVPHARSLKAKRAAIRPIIDGGRHRFPVSLAEVDHQDTWQRAAVGAAMVSSSATLAAETIDELERFVWSHPDIEVANAERSWLEW